MKRYAFFLLAAILTFALGVASAVLIGRVDLFPRAQTRRCSPHRRLSSMHSPKRPLTVYTFYRSDGTVVRSYDVDKAYGLESLGRAKEQQAAQASPSVVTDTTPRTSR